MAPRERRRHRAIYTENTEYHLHDELCVAVRERATGRWLDDHPAVGAELQPQRSWRERPGSMVGLRALFALRPGEVIATSPITEVARPDREAVGHYRLHPCGRGDTPTRPTRRLASAGGRGR